MEKKTISVIISEKDWKFLVDKTAKTVRIYKETELHYEFGDYPEKHITRVEICRK